MSFERRLSRVRRAVIVAPHPDDETIGAFGVICSLVRAGVQVTVKVVTDGAASHPASRTWPPRRLARARRGEVVAAMRLAGLHKGDIAFLGFPDGQLAAMSGAERKDIVCALAAGPMPDLVLRPSLRDAHPDHVVVAQACRHAWPRRVLQAAYLVWPAGQGLTRTQAHALRGEIVLKQAALRMFRTQTGTVTDDPDGFQITKDLQRIFSRPAEHFCLSE